MPASAYVAGVESMLGSVEDPLPLVGSSHMAHTATLRPGTSQTRYQLLSDPGRSRQWRMAPLITLALAISLLVVLHMHVAAVQLRIVHRAGGPAQTG